jgi:transposase
MIEAQRAEIAELVSLSRLQQNRIDWLLRQMFGRKSEQVDPNQMSFDFGPLVAPKPEPEPDPDPSTPAPAPTGKRRSKKGHGRKDIPEDLPVQRKDLGPKASERLCPCHNQPMRCAREEVTRKLDLEPARIFVVETHSEIAVCAHGGDAIAVAPVPPAIIDKGLAGPGLLAFVVTSKFVDHLPLYRIELIFERWGIPLARSTLCGWIAQLADALLPVYQEIRRQLLLETFLQSDDTLVRVLRGENGPFTGRFWAWRGVASGLVFYEYAKSRSGEIPRSFLAGWSGRLQADAYAGYDAVYKSGVVVEFGCWAHARRKVFESLDSDRQRARDLLALIWELFLIERDLDELEAEGRRARRQEQSRPVLRQIAELCAEYARTVLPKTPLGNAVGYIQNNWKALERFVDDGEAEIHNNAIENAIRPLAIGRKNWLFAGSPEGGRRAAILFTLVENCRRIGINPEAYFRDLFDRLPTHPNRLIAELTPHGWKAARERELAERAAAVSATA